MPENLSLKKVECDYREVSDNEFLKYLEPTLMALDNYSIARERPKSDPTLSTATRYNYNSNRERPKSDYFSVLIPPAKRHQLLWQHEDLLRNLNKNRNKLKELLSHEWKKSIESADIKMPDQDFLAILPKTIRNMARLIHDIRRQDPLSVRNAEGRIDTLGSRSYARW